MNSKRVLIIRSSPMEAFLKHLRHIVEMNKDAEFHCFCQENIKGSMQETNQFQKIITYPGGPIEIGLIDSNTTEKLVKNKYDKIYVSKSKMPVSNVCKFARSLKSKKAIIINPEMIENELTWFQLIRDSIRMKLLAATTAFAHKMCKRDGKIITSKNLKGEDDVAIIGIHNAPVPPTNDCSVSRIAYQTAEAVERDNVVICSPWEKEACIEARTHKKKYLFYQNTRIERFFDWVREKSFMRKYAFGWLFNKKGYAAKYTKNIVNYLADFPPKLIIGHNTAGIEIIRHAISLMPSTSLAIFMNNHLWEFIEKEDAEFIFNNIIGFISISQELIDRARKGGFLKPETPTYLVHNGIDTDAFHPSRTNSKKAKEFRESFSPNGEPTILFASQLIEGKGLHYLLAALPLVQEKIPDVKVIVAGSNAIGTAYLPEGSYEKFLHFSVTENNLPVEFIGYVRYQNVPDLIVSCDIYTLPSQYTIEGQPSSVLEAMACGKAPVCSRAGGIPEAIDNGVHGIMIDPTDSEEYAAALIDLIKHPEKQQEMGQNARNKAEEYFSFNRMGKDFDNAVNDLLSRRNS